MGGRLSDTPSQDEDNSDEEEQHDSPSELFHEVEAYYLSIGMTYDQFWHGDVWLAKVYRDAQEIREQRENIAAWRSGIYMVSALNATVGNMFMKKGSKPAKYMSRPLPLTYKDKKAQELEQQREAQERIKRMMFALAQEDENNG